MQVAKQTATALNGKTKALIRESLRKHGLFNAMYALHPTFFPYFDPFRGCPQDVMHNEFSSGTANSELATMLYIFISKEKWFNVEMLNAEIEKHDWGDGRKPPAIWEGVVKGQRGGLPEAGAHLRYTGSQTKDLALASRQILLPLVQNQEHPAWLSWCAHLDYIELLLADSFTPSSITDLDKAIQRHHKL